MVSTHMRVCPHCGLQAHRLTCGCVRPSPYVCATCKSSLPYQCATGPVIDRLYGGIAHICQCTDCLGNWRASFTIVLCAACEGAFPMSQQYAYNAGNYYCSEPCYDTLFEPCDTCGKLNMSVAVNARCKDVHICDGCYDTANNLTSCTLVFGPFKK
jgi:hypothetical protein